MELKFLHIGKGINYGFEYEGKRNSGIYKL